MLCPYALYLNGIGVKIRSEDAGNEIGNGAGSEY